MLGCRYHSEVTVFHVVPKNDYPRAWMDTPVDPDWWGAHVSDARKHLESVLVDELRGISVKRIVTEGDPAMQIAEFAHSDGTNLIVMPTHGYGPFRRFIIGSVTTRVLDDADCPVMTGAHMEREMLPELVPFRNILCAIDLGIRLNTAVDRSVCCGFRRSSPPGSCFAVDRCGTSQLFRSRLAAGAGSICQRSDRQSARNDRYEGERHHGFRGRCKGYPKCCGVSRSGLGRDWPPRRVWYSRTFAHPCL